MQFLNLSGKFSNFLDQLFNNALLLVGLISELVNFKFVSAVKFNQVLVFDFQTFEIIFRFFEFALLPLEVPH